MSDRMRVDSRIRTGVALGVCALLASGVSGCGFLDGGNASIENIVAGGNLHDGELEVWLTLKFDEVPPSTDPRDVRVVFSGKALDTQKTFDWEFIALHDTGKHPSGWGRIPLPETTPETDPPLGMPLDVKFPLFARRKIPEGGNITVKAELFWGKERQDSNERNINQMYKSEG